MVSAQIEELFVARDDASVYIEHYMNPAFNGLMYALNSGWYSQSKTHKKLGFDLSFSSSLAFVPESEQSFQFNPNEYQHLSVSGSGTLPTVTGENTEDILTYHTSVADVNINALDGFGKNWMESFFIPIAIPAPMVQASMGLPFHTDVIVRFFPKTSNKDVSFNMFGGGFKHDLTHYFTKEESTFNMSAIVAANRISVTYTPQNTNISGSGQKTNMHLNTFMAQAVAGVHFKLINFYGAVGYVSGNTAIDVRGNYEFDIDNNGSISSDEVITDPFQLRFAQSGVKSTLGARVNLGPVKIFGDYSFQKFNTLTAGLAISFR